MQYNTGGNPIIYYDSCACCNLDTGGNHASDCPCRVKPKESYPEFVQRKQEEIDAHPEWGIKYL